MSPTDAFDLDGPEEHAFMTPLSLAVCRERLRHAFDRQDHHGDGRNGARVTGELLNDTFSIWQHVLKSPLDVPRVAEGTLSAKENGAYVAFQMHLREYPFTGLRVEPSALRVVHTLLGVGWRQFDAQEATFVRDWLLNTLDGELLRTPHQSAAVTGVEPAADLLPIELSPPTKHSMRPRSKPR
jgi:hypothetical protein